METLETNNNTTPVERPGPLTALCIFTFIYSGLFAIVSFFVPMVSDVFVQFLEMAPAPDPEQHARALEVVTAGWFYHFTSCILACISLYGAFMMWNLRKQGFHYYALANLALLFVPTLVLGISVNTEAIILTIVYIGFYAVFLKIMK